MLEIEVHGRTPHRQRDKDRKGQQGHRVPGDIRDGILDILSDVHLLGGRRLDTLFGREERHPKQDEGDRGIEDDSSRPSLRLVATSQMIYQRKGQSLNHKLGNRHQDESDGSDTGALTDITGHHTTQRGIWYIIKGIDGHQQHIGDRGVGGYHSLLLNAGIIEGKHIEDAERNRRPEHPGTELTPAGLRAVGKDTDERIDHDSRQTTNH